MPDEQHNAAQEFSIDRYQGMVIGAGKML